MNKTACEDTVAFLNRMVTVQTADELWSLLTERMAGYGFDRLLYGCTRNAFENAVGSKVDWIVLSNHTPDYIRRFLTPATLAISPMVNWTLNNFGCKSWRDVQQKSSKGNLSEAEIRHMEFNRAAQVTAGYTISFVTTGRRQRAGISLVAAPGLDQEAVEEIWSRDGAEIALVCNVAHLKIISLPNLGFTNLSPRQREVLELVGDGKSSAEIAQVLEISVAMVEKHLRLARERLGVDTTAQALLKAAFFNQVYVGSA